MKRDGAAAKLNGVGGNGALLGTIAMTFLALSAACGFGQAAAAPDRTAVLDRVVAVVGDRAVLASDVDEEMRFAAFQPSPEPASDNTPQRALDRVIERTLIDEQRALQPGLASVSDAQVQKAVKEMRESIPACAAFGCKTDAGWQRFLEAHGFTQQEVEDRIRERLAILNFIDVRFGVATRVPNAAVQKYYDEVLAPQLTRAHAALPPISSVATRIREVLRQQQVSAMLDQWLKGLRSEDHIRILDPAYGNGEAGQ